MFKYTKQEGLQDCGICCLLNIIRYYGGNTDIEKLRKMTNTNEGGTSIYNLLEASNKLGFESKAYKCKINDLDSQTYPLIAYIKIKGYNHFVIINDITSDIVDIFDPIRGRIKYKINDFLNEWQNVIITFDRKGDIIKENSDYTNYILNIFKNYKKKIIIIAAFSFLSSIFSIIYSLFIKILFDNKFTSNTLILFLIFILLKGIIDYYRNKQSIDMNNKLDFEITNSVYKKILSLPLKYHHDRPVGDIIYRINDLNNIKEFFNTFTISSIIDILFFIIALFILLFISFKLFLIIILITISFVFIYIYFRRNNILYINELKEISSTNNADLSEMLYGIDTIKNLNIEDKFENKHNLIFNEYLNSFKKTSSYFNKENIIFNYIESSGLIFIMFIGLGLLKGHSISLGELSLVFSLYISYFGALKNILSLDRLIVQSKISFKRINNLLNIKKISRTCNSFLKKIDEIKFTGKLNLTVNKGDFVLVNGISGIGKSTLFKSLYESNNSIFINNKPIDEISINSIKNNICYVGQNEYLFTGSLKSNLLMFKGSNNKEINKALKTTLLDKTIKSKNINLDYLLEENGHNLSGGEKKKILLTRALLRNTDYIIFDETFDEIDIESERKIINNIKTNYKKTIIVISHRLSNCDLYNKKVQMM